MSSIAKFKDQVRDLSNPKNFQKALDLKDYSKDLLVSSLNRMILIRRVEEKLALEKESDTIGGPVHLGAGQEGIAVGISANLKKTDRVFGAHRSHSHVLALDSCVYELFAEVLGKDTGLSKGMGGSMHLTNTKSGFMGSVPIVAGTVPLAVGASFDSKYRNKDDIGVAYIGDGAIEEGIVHESLNLSKILDTPTLFVVENNLFSSHMHISLRQPSSLTSRFAIANEIDFEICDGNDVIQVYEKSKSLINDIRKSGGPKFIEAITYRHYGHVDYRKDIDVGVNRSEEDLENWLLRDPIERLKKSMLDKSIITKDEILSYEEELASEINKSWERALNDPYPNSKTLLGRVYYQND